MKHKYSIGIFIIFLVFILFLTGSARFGSKAKINETENTDLVETQTETSVVADGQALKEDCFYLLEVNGYVVVYLSDKKTPYEYTDILYDDLPNLLQNEIRNGKYIESLEELYGFLENYSS